LVLFVVVLFVGPTTSGLRLDARLGAAEPLGVRVPEGFEALLFADDDLAHDIISLTVDSLGRVVVSGPGYVRILLDRDGDGRADAYQQYADGPKTGAQGMHFDGRDLICTGDAGLIRYRDANADDRADGPPETLLSIKAGGEHHVHSVQRGPDGWWYVMAGNMAGVTEKTVTLPTSPVLRPRAGTLLRLKPDFSGCEVVAHGFRNAYDFAFNAQGDIFTYDSDGEREVSLPWYRPTRVFHVLPGSDAGWVSETWKHPDYYPDMPPVVASLGRGSPTGVVCYRHNRFPAEYRGALFVADWTFGRIVALPLTRDGETWKTTPKDFMTGSGTFGFAPTDMEVGPDGSVYVSVGGRGTRGGVYRVQASKPASGKRQLPGDHAKSMTKAEEIAACLSAPEPLSSWSRARWLPLAKKLGRVALQTAALDENLPTAERVRAIEILLDLGESFDAALLEKLSRASSVEVCARSGWLLGYDAAEKPMSQIVARLIVHEDPAVARNGLEWLLRAPFRQDFLELESPISRTLQSSRRFVADAALRVASRVRTHGSIKVLGAANDKLWLRFDLATALRRPAIVLPTQAISHWGRMTKRTSVPYCLDALRLTQLVLGDFGPGNHAVAFDGYASREDLSKKFGDWRSARDLDQLSQDLSLAFPANDAMLDMELARTVAMLESRTLAIVGPRDPEFRGRVLAKISDRSSPIEDIHYLLVLARLVAKPKDGQREKTATALLALDDKAARLKLSIDTNWEPSISAMYDESVKRDPGLPGAVVRHASFGRPEHVVFAKNLPAELLPTAIAAFEKRMREDKDFAVSADLVFLLGRSQAAAHLDLVRQLYADRLAVRGATLIVLAMGADAVDRPKFVVGLDESEPEVLSACLEALAKLPWSAEAKEQIALLRALRRLSGDEREYALRDKAAALLKRSWNQDFGFIAGKAGHRPQPQAVNKWTDFLRGKFPDEFARQTGGGAAADAAAVKALLAQADWSRGDAARGAKVFDARSCSRCHSGRTALGPDLAGAARRFSRDDLFTAIVEPSRDVSPRYQSTMIQTTDGKTYGGLVIYESVDGVTLRDGLNQTIRIDGPRIEARRKQAASLMPNGLLKDLKAEDLADLYAYLQSIGK
jgi:putative membrane-bound dehydrogenase-like protein